MKLRLGFVSNSSVSSFLVKLKAEFDKKKEKPFIATEEDIQQLESFGFVRAKAHGVFGPIEPDEAGDWLYYHLICNQDEPLDFLVSNNIPFKASIHYNHTYMSYQRNRDHVLVAHNYGIRIDMYGEDHHEQWEKIMAENTTYRDNEEPVRKIPKEDFIATDEDRKGYAHGPNRR